MTKPRHYYAPYTALQGCGKTRNTTPNISDVTCEKCLDKLEYQSHDFLCQINEARRNIKPKEEKE